MSYNYGKFVSVRKDIYVNFYILSLIRLGVWVMEIQLLLELNGGISQEKALQIKIKLELNHKK